MVCHPSQPITEVESELRSADTMDQVQGQGQVLSEEVPSQSSLSGDAS